MAERVYTDGEISLNGVKYPIKGPVTSFLASVYPEKQVVGSVTEDSNPYVSVISWTDFTGGTGLYRMRTPADNRRYYVSSCFTSRQGQVTLGPTTYAVGSNGTSTVLGTYPFLGELPSGASSAGEIYAFGSNKVIFKWDSATDSWAAVGLSLVVHACDAVWNELVDADVTVVQDQADKKEGTGANQFQVAAGASAGDILATDDFAAKDLSTYTELDFWIKSSVGTTSGQLQLLLDDTASCASPLETLDVPALTANTWKRCRITLANPGSDTAIISVGLKYTADIGACTIRIDDIRATKAATTAPTDACNALVNGTYYLVYACTTNILWSSDGSSWTENGQDALYVCAWNEQLWGITSAGQLWYTSDMSTFTNDAVLPSGAGTIKGLTVGRDRDGEPIIYALTTKGLYAHDFANTKFWQTEFTETSGIHHGRPRESNGAVCMPIDDVVWMYRASTGQAIATSPVLPDGFAVTDSDLNATAAFGPHVIAIAPMGGRLYALTGHTDGATQTVQMLHYFDGSAWHNLWQGSALRGTASQNLLASGAYNARRLWFGASAQATYMINYANLPTFTGNLTEWMSTGGRFTLPWFDGFDAMAVKTALRAHVNVRGTSATETVAVYYALNYGVSSMTLLGTITNSDGVTTYEFPDSTTPTGSDFRAIRFTTVLATTGTTATPTLVSISLEYRKKPAVRMGFEMDLDLTSDYGAKTPQGLRSALETAIASTTKVEFTFRDDTGTGNPRNYYVDIKSPRSLEKTGRQEEGLTHLVLIET